MDTIEAAGMEATESLPDGDDLGAGYDTAYAVPATWEHASSAVMFLAVSLVLTIALMIPVTWT
jgi:hypothetical protein